MYTKLGEGVVGTIVDLMFKRLLQNPLLAPFFAHVDVKRHKQVFTQYLEMNWGAPMQFYGKSLARAHGHMVRHKGLCDKHFDAFVEHLVCARARGGRFLWRVAWPCVAGMHWKGRRPHPPSRAPSLRPATFSLTASDHFNGVYDRQ